MWVLNFNPLTFTGFHTSLTYCLVSQSSSVARVSRLESLKPSRISSRRKLACLSPASDTPVTLPALADYAARYFRTATAEILVHGNVSTEAALELARSVRGRTTSTATTKSETAYIETGAAADSNPDATLEVALADDNKPQQPIVQLPAGPAIVLAVRPDNLGEKNRCVELYYQLCTFNVPDLTKLELLEQVSDYTHFVN